MYTYERYNFRMLTPLLVIMSIVFFSYQAWAGGVIAVVLGAFLLWSYQGIRIDGPGKRFMRYDRFTRVKIGRWENLPDPSYVTIVRINLSARRTQPGPIILPEDSKGAKAFKVNLVVEGDIRYIPVCRGALKDMKEEALSLGRALDVRVLDYTTHEKHWIL
jgi:hypothetical protein